VIEQRFGSEPPLTLGVEEELMILDAVSLDQVGAVERILAGLDGEQLPGQAKTELHASIFELTTHPAPDSQHVLDALVGLRRAAAAAAEAEGLAIAAAGTHPFARPEQQPIVQEERYLTMVERAGASARRQGVQGLHVHVSMRDADECWTVLEAILPWLPVVLALSANSPWLAGELTGMESNRAFRLAELPRAGPPPAFGGYEAWEQWVERLVGLGVFEDATRIWWDVRPAPHLGTLEVRIADQPTDVRRSAALAALVQALCAVSVDGDGTVAGPGARADYLQNRFAAARLGPRAELIHPQGDRTATAAELAAELLALVAPTARELGSSELLALLDPETCEAELQSRHASAPDAAADLVRRSLA
jgi:carboxylate-amine ligase